MNAWLEARYADAKKAYEALMKFYPFGLEDLDGEIWHDILNYEGLYQISTFGRVKSFNGRWGEVKILKPKITRRGYLAAGLHKDGAVKFFLVHRLVAQAFVPNPNDLPEVDHVYGMKFDNSVWNLRWATSAENTRYAVESGAAKTGEKRFGSKLTDEQARYIRENPDSLKGKQLVEKFGVGETVICRIQTGETYKNAGGSVRQARKHNCLNDNQRAEVRKLYVFGSKEFGSVALGRQYGVDSSVILRIIRENRR